MQSKKLWLPLALMIAFAPAAFGWCEKTNVKTFVDKMVTKNHFERTSLCKLFDQYPTNTSVVAKMKKPFESVSWERYRRLLVSKQRIAAGKRFRAQHTATLKQAEERFGVDASAVLAILAIESNYGQQKMPYHSLDALLTLAFDYPPRARFFTSELEALLLLARENHLDAGAIGGSYAGAIGIPQFMPSNYRRLAVASSPDHKPDLTHNADDAIMSVANYLHHFGWQHKQPILITAKPGKNAFTPDPDNPETTWRKDANFAVIMKYNKSPVYAAAVGLLAQALES